MGRTKTLYKVFWGDITEYDRRVSAVVMGRRWHTRRSGGLGLGRDITERNRRLGSSDGQEVAYKAKWGFWVGERHDRTKQKTRQ